MTRIPTAANRGRFVNTVNIASGGGAITLGGGSGPITAEVLNADGTVATPASGYAIGDYANPDGIYLSGTTINADTGGNIIMNGKGGSYADNNNNNTNEGIYTGDISSITTSGSGSIKMSGIGTVADGPGDDSGIFLGDYSNVQTQNGVINLNGTVGSGGGSGEECFCQWWLPNPWR